MNYFPLGVNSNHRLWIDPSNSDRGFALFVKGAHGSRLVDVDGNEYIDYRMGFGSVILGHAYPPVVREVRETLRNGTTTCLSLEAEAEVAKLMTESIPHGEQFRFSNSGTEAILHAIHLSRGFTRRDSILKFEGHYHGLFDSVLLDTDLPRATNFRQIESLGIPRAISGATLLARWNDFDQVERIMKRNGNRIAGILLEPVMGNCLGIPPREGFLEFLREKCDQYGSMLIFDEVKTGFRLSRGGAAGKFEVTPDIFVVSKAMANGFPISAVGGRKRIMSSIDIRKVRHGGTFAGNAVSLAAAKATLRLLSSKPVNSRIDDMGSRLMRAFDDILRDRHIPHKSVGYPSMFQIAFTRLQEIKEWRDLLKCSIRFFPRFQMTLLRNGVIIDQDPMEVWMCSYSHDQADVDFTITAFDKTCRELQGELSNPRKGFPRLDA